MKGASGLMKGAIIEFSWGVMAREAATNWIDQEGAKNCRFNQM